MALYITEEEVSRLLSMKDALEAVENVFGLQGMGKAVNLPRNRVRLPSGALHVMSAGVPELNAVGLKCYTTTPKGAHFVVLLFEADTGELLTMMEADRLGQTRTGAASGVATRHLSRTDAQTVGLIGAGWQARSQLAAVCAVRPVREAFCYSRTEARRNAFCQEMSRTLGIETRPASSAEEAVRDRDIIITITAARDPVLSGSWIKPGAHINAAGSNALIRAEIDIETVQRAALIVVDSREQAKMECGDLLAPIERGLIHWDQVRELGEIVAGRFPGRTSDQDITLFESQGLAIEDMAVAAVVYARAKEQGVGRPLPS